MWVIEFSLLFCRCSFESIDTVSLLDHSDKFLIRIAMRHGNLYKYVRIARYGPFLDFFRDISY